MPNKMRAIQTVYAGIEFRSRLEAKWAAFFTQLGWEWMYEPFDGNGYIPDFVVTMDDRQLLIEVKPFTEYEQFSTIADRTALGIENHWDKDSLIVGCSPLLRNKDITIAGLLGRQGNYNRWNYSHKCSNAGGDEHSWMSHGATQGQYEGWGVLWMTGYWIKQRHWDGGYSITLVGDAESVSSKTDPFVGYEEICWTGNTVDLENSWAIACNEVKWRGR